MPTGARPAQMRQDESVAREIDDQPRGGQAVPERFASDRGEYPTKLIALATMVLITVPMIIIGGAGVSALWIYVGVVAAMMLPLRWALVIATALAAAMLVLNGLSGAGLPWELALALVALALWMAGFVGNIRLNVELRATR